MPTFHRTRHERGVAGVAAAQADEEKRLGPFDIAMHLAMQLAMQLAMDHAMDLAMDHASSDASTRLSLFEDSTKEPCHERTRQIDREQRGRRKPRFTRGIGKRDGHDESQCRTECATDRNQREALPQSQRAVRAHGFTPRE